MESTGYAQTVVAQEHQSLPPDGIPAGDSGSTVQVEAPVRRGGRPKTRAKREAMKARGIPCQPELTLPGSNRKPRVADIVEVTGCIGGDVQNQPIPVDPSILVGMDATPMTWNQSRGLTPMPAGKSVVGGEVRVPASTAKTAVQSIKDVGEITTEELISLIPSEQCDSDAIRVVELYGVRYRFTQEAVRRARHAVALMFSGLSLTKACELLSLPLLTVQVLTAEGGPLHGEYTRARGVAAETRVDQMLDMIDSEPDPRKAQIKAGVIQWYASKIVPRIYGEKVQHEVAGNIQINLGIRRKHSTGGAIDVESTAVPAISPPEES